MWEGVGKENSRDTTEGYKALEKIGSKTLALVNDIVEENEKGDG